MTISRYLKKFKTWMSCAYKADKDTAGYEYPHERYVIYHYVYYGSAKLQNHLQMMSLLLKQMEN